ncbi:MAG: MFS transporter [Bacteroidetes bacterium]|nr:MFS transporter [Bacteroidota bacterium]
MTIGAFSILTDNFKILSNRDIRVYLSGNAVSLIGDWMQQTAQAWVVWELTHSTTALGVVAFFSQIPFFLFGPWVGVVSDRYDRRKILLVTQFLIMLFAFILAALVQWHWLKLWHVYVLAFLLGIVTAFDVTAEQAFMSDIAGAGNIRKAVALNNSLTQLTRLVGPSIAGWLIAQVGVAPSFWLNGLTIIITILCIAAVRAHRDGPAETGSGLQQFREGWLFFRKHGLLQLIMIFAAVQAFFGLSTIQLLPAVASDILKGNASTLGLLLGAAGGGALIGIVVVMPFVEQIKRPCMAIGGALIWSGVWYILFSRSHGLYFTMLCQFMASLGAANVVTLSIGLSQELTPPGMRARIVSTFLMIIFGLQPVASYLVGAGAHQFGLQPIILVNGISMILIPAALLTLPRLHQLRRPAGVEKPKDHCVGF